ncbi:sporadic carbohydrate cluster 2OG-Fe(II) oxygenase [Leptospira limi]|uniref:2OG-Fe(II) oxygenase n=1 Tax=Leptospira limi TaxID=2950023 RepID=A0ABT3LZ44_9LEPT|nr:sporadic carbohydrate cluster 2OG-Fe(II) oxygenase [Leptospira limi]MCW7462994.1 2OG-Fe(II) oxygenase [Leptospira limi]
MFFSEKELELSKQYFEEGYVIAEAANQDSLNWIRGKYVSIIKDILSISKDISSDEDLFGKIHEKVKVSELNDFRLKVIQSINSEKDFRFHYFQVAKPYLEALVGNELAMQLRVNLSIQFPNDDSSLLPVHSDTWSGDSPYEVVVWLPLVDCYKTKSMYILPPKETDILFRNFGKKAGVSSEELYQSISKDVKFLEINYGQVLLFNQGLPHGNRINLEPLTRWTMNCRFKGVFTPYGDKKLGEFFEPITLRSASRVGMDYFFPTIQ